MGRAATARAHAACDTAGHPRQPGVARGPGGGPAVGGTLQLHASDNSLARGGGRP
jgi:hypothetical protein